MNEPMKVSSIFLRLHLMVPPSGLERRRGLPYWIGWISVLLGVITFTLIPLFISAYYEYKNKVWIRMGVTVADILSFLGGSIMYIAVFSSQRQIVLLLKDIPNLEKDDQPKNFPQICKRLNILSCLHYAYMTGAFMARFLFNYAYIDICKKDNQFFEYEITCGLFLTLALPFEWKSQSWKILFGICQIICTFILIKGVASIPYLLYEFASFLEIRAAHLNKMIVEIFQSECLNIQRRNLIACVEYHRNIYEHARKLNNAFCRASLIQFIFTAAVLGALSNLLIKRFNENEVTVLADMMHLFAWFASSLLSCHAGEKLTCQFDSISKKLYESKWYDSEVILQKDFNIFQRVTLRPVVLTRGQFGPLSYPLFVAMVKSSYSYMALLQHGMK